MVDPQVISLRYRLKTADTLEFVDPSPLQVEQEGFDLLLADGYLSARLKDPPATEGEARALVEPYLKAYEMAATLQYGRRQLGFVLEDAEIIYPDEVVPVPRRVKRTASVTARVAGKATVTNVALRKRYPDLPDGFVASADVEAMWSLYEGYVLGRDRLLPMAYSCLSRLEYAARNRAEGKSKRAKAARMFRIDGEVLKRLGDYTANLGDEVGARKLGEGSKLRPPTAEETTWIEDTLRVLIYRAGQHAANPEGKWPMITAENLREILPPIPPDDVRRDSKVIRYR